MQFSEILCLATYDWFCADGSHLLQNFIGKPLKGLLLLPAILQNPPFLNQMCRME